MDYDAQVVAEGQFHLVMKYEVMRNRERFIKLFLLPHTSANSYIAIHQIWQTGMH